MPTPLHEYVTEEVAGVIRDQLKDFKALSGTRTAEVATNIYGSGSRRIQFPSRVVGKNNRNCPDKCYKHEPCRAWPTLIIEIAWSQRPLDLADKAKKYIQYGKGHVRTVVGLDLEYRPTTEATPRTSARFLVWRTELPNQRGAYSAGAPDKQVRFSRIFLSDP